MALDISRAFDRVWHTSLLHKRKSYEISDQIFHLIPSFLSNRHFQLVLDEKFSQEYPRLEILESSFLVLHISHYTFLMMLTVIFLSILVIPLSILSVIRHPIRGNSLTWLLKLNLIYKTLWNGARSGLMVSMLRKRNWFRLV